MEGPREGALGDKRIQKCSINISNSHDHLEILNNGGSTIRNDSWYEVRDNEGEGNTSPPRNRENNLESVKNNNSIVRDNP